MHTSALLKKMKSVANKEMIKITLVLVCNYNYFLYGVQIIILLFIEKLSPLLRHLRQMK